MCEVSVNRACNIPFSETEMLCLPTPLVERQNFLFQSTRLLSGRDQPRNTIVPCSLL